MVKAIAITKPIIQVDGKDISADELMGYVARVSNPSNQNNLDTIPKLLNYCIKNKHWSIFEQADLTVEITTSRVIAQQIIRHRSFTFQEFSQRYAKALNVKYYDARSQDLKNRQNSVDDLSDEVKQLFKTYQIEVWESAYEKYEDLLSKGVAKETARFILPLNTETTIYMKGNVRSWLTYLLVRLEKGTQKEHRDIAEEIWKILKNYYPLTCECFKALHPGAFS